MKKILFILFITSFAFAQNADRKYISNTWLTSNQFENAVFVVEVSDGSYYFNFYDDSIVETTFLPSNEKLNTSSSVVNLKSKNIEKIFSEEELFLELNAKNLKIRIQKSPFQISYFDKNNELLFSEKNGYSKIKHIPLEKVKGNIIADSLEVIDFNISADEILYGGGARVLGMNRRGNRLALYNRADYGYEKRSELMNFTLPIVISSKKYMIHFDNEPIGYLDLDSQKNNTIAYQTISGKKRYQVVVGDSWEDLVGNYTQLTGKQPMIPSWALGNFSSRFGYHSEAEARKTIQKFKEDKIPVDAIILDLYWFGKDIKGTMGNLEVFRDSFPNFEKMIADFTKIGVKTITVTEPFILTTSKKWEETKTKKLLATNKDGSEAIWDFYFGNTALIDVFKPEAKEWFWSIYKDLANKGVAGVWGDLGEPEVFPSSANTVAGTADEVHNSYGHNWAKLIYEGYQKDFPSTRPFILMRAGAAGSQRFGMIPWSGDVNRSWGGLSGQVEIALQMGMQGLAYMHSDLGGFAGDLEDDELYARWLQYGVFQPVFRPHAQEETASEPVFRSNEAKKLAKQAIELRYSLLPYNYNLVFENSQTGKPLMRPLFFEEPTNQSLYTKADGYLWGNDFLVYPILQAAQKTKEIYFPKGSNWFDFYTNRLYEGGSIHNLVTFENHIPTFVRAGSVIPMTENLQNTEEYANQNLIFHYYYDETIVEEKEQNFYFDDGKTPNNYENENYFTIDFETEKEGKWLEIDIEKQIAKNYPLKPLENYKVIVHNINKMPKKYKIKGSTTTYNYDKLDRSCTFIFKELKDKTEIRIKL